MENVDLLKKVRIFQGLTEEELNKFAAITSEEQSPPKSILLEEGVEGQALYIIKRGAVTVYKVKNDSLTELAKLPAGEAFGEMSLLEATLTSARVTANNEVECLLISRDLFLDLLERDLSIAAKVYKNFTLILSERLRQTSAELARCKPEP
ncbi:MAG TPA: cyclic nucleotide-binding domain-containing protein [bacterium]|nr:cyclic nucleotide-binding domain-containing protein [bacterium]